MDLIAEPLSPDLVATEGVVSIDEEGGAALRCCLRHSRAGEAIRLIRVTPPGPAGAYAESGPVFVHAQPCDGPASSGYPGEFRSRRQVLRAYGLDGTIVGGELVEADVEPEAVAQRLLNAPDVAFLQSRNVVYGCYLFTIRRPLR